MFTLESFKKHYDLTTTEVVIRDRRFCFFLPRTIDRFFHSQDIFQDFPLWVKIWEASFILAEYLAGLAVEPEKRFLEIGCGLGVVGIVASSFGHKVTMTEYNEDALNFAQANALLNSASSLEIRKLDWNRPEAQGPFDYILGSEVTYRESDFKALFDLFRTYLKEGGEIVLAEGIRKTSLKFMKQMSDSFNIKAHKRFLRSMYEEIPVMLCRMKLK